MSSGTGLLNAGNDVAAACDNDPITFSLSSILGVFLKVCGEGHTTSAANNLLYLSQGLSTAGQYLYFWTYKR